MEHASIRSIQVGLPATHGDPRAAEAMEQEWTTAFFKLPVAGPVWAGREGLAGDGQADRRFHGGVDKAVLAYAASHYPLWQIELAMEELPFGAFGENLTIDGLDEAGVAIGDRWQAGEVLLEVSQPRQPCWKMGRRWKRKELPKLAVQCGRSGWYFRVLREGELAGTQELRCVARPHPEWSVQRANRAMYASPADRAGRQELAVLPELSQAWREELSRRS